MIGKVNRPKESLVISPTVKVWPRCRLCARSFGRKPSSLRDGDDLVARLLPQDAAVVERLATVPMLTLGGARDIVDGERRARRALLAAASARCRRPCVLRSHFTTPLRRPET